MEAGGQPGSPAASDEEAQCVRKPMYEDDHESCSVLLAKIRNDHLLLAYDAHDQFRWLHRFYLVLDRIAEQHRVYKLYGGPHGFMISTGVAETDEDHASTLLRFSLHVLQAMHQIRLPGPAPVDLCMVLASGRAASGLLGTTSLTYQIVGRPVAIARELMEGQKNLPFMVTSGLYQLLADEVVAELAEAGTVELACCPGEREVLYTLPRWRSLPITAPGSGPRLLAGSQLRASSGEPSSAAAGEAGAAGAADTAAAAAAAAGAADAKRGLAAGGSAPASAEATTPAGSEEVAATTAAAQLVGQGRGSSPSSGASVQSASNASHGSGPAAAKLQAGKEARMAPASKPPRPPIAGKAGRPAGAAAAAAAPIKKHGSRLLSARLATQHWARGLMQPLDSSLPFNTQDTDDSWLSHCDLLLRFNNPGREAAFARFYSTAQAMPELAWMAVGLLTVLLYYMAAAGRGTAVPLELMLPFQALPVLGAVMWRWHRKAYLRWREAMWFVQRLLVLIMTSLPGSFALVAPGSAAFGFGLGSLALEMLTRRLRLHLQLLSSLLVYVIGLSLMGLHDDGSPARQLINPRYLSLHLVATCLAPVFLAALFDVSARRTFATRLKALDLWERPQALESTEQRREQEASMAAAAAAAAARQQARAAAAPAQRPAKTAS